MDFERDVIESMETTLLTEFFGEDDHTPHNYALCWMHSEELDRKEGRDFCVKAFLSCRLFFGPFLSPHDHPQRGHE